MPVNNIFFIELQFVQVPGLQDKMQSAGINTGGLLKGLLSFAGPMILGGLLSGAMNRRSGGGLGNAGLGGGGFMPGGGGGLGSIIGMLGGGRGFGGVGGLLGKNTWRRKRILIF